MGTYIVLAILGAGLLYVRSAFSKAVRNLATVVGGALMLVGLVAILYKIVAPIILLLVCIVIAGFAVTLLLNRRERNHDGDQTD